MDFLKDLNIDKVRNLAEDAFNQAKPKTDVEARVYEVLSHKNWGSSTTLMNEVAQDTTDYERFLIVTKLMWEGVENQRPAAWRIIFKGLSLCEHLVKNGSERCVDDARNHSHLLRSLDRFNYYEGTVDRGSGVREKAKQLIELLGDDERVREERTKSRQLRDRFAGKTSTAGSKGGGGSKQSEGYGNNNDAWKGGGGGYGDSGIGSSNQTTNQNFAGRYGEGGVDSGSKSAISKAPSATQSTGKKSSKSTKTPKTTSSTKTKKIKKKEKAQPAPAPAPEIDLFSFDSAPVPSVPVNSGGDEFDAFQTASSNTAADDDFGDFQQTAPSSNVQFDAFGSAPTASPQKPAMPQQQAQFNAFGGNSMQPMQQQQPMMGNQQMQGGGTSGMNDMFGNMGMQNQKMQQMQGAAPTPAMANNGAAADNGDDFGDFEDADPFANSTVKSSDPLSKLISLDGLMKNEKKENKLNQPVVVNEAAFQYVQQMQQQGPGANNIGAQMSFQGIDGLGNNRDLIAKGTQGNNLQQGQPIMGSGIQGKVGVDNIAMMAPQMGGNQGMGMMQGGGMMGNAGGMNQQGGNGMMGGNQGMGRMQGGGMMGGAGGMNQQGNNTMMGNNQGQGMMQGGGNMMGGAGMMNQQQGGMMQGGGNMSGNGMMNQQGGMMQGGNMGNMGGMGQQQSGGQMGNTGGMGQQQSGGQMGNMGMMGGQMGNNNGMSGGQFR